MHNSIYNAHAHRRRCNEQNAMILPEGALILPEGALMSHLFHQLMHLFQHVKSGIIFRRVYACIAVAYASCPCSRSSCAGTDDTKPNDMPRAWRRMCRECACCGHRVSSFVTSELSNDLSTRDLSNVAKASFANPSSC